MNVSQNKICAVILMRKPQTLTGQLSVSCGHQSLGEDRCKYSAILLPQGGGSGRTEWLNIYK